MALRDQPYLPLYIQDFMTDEKLIECSASTTGVYIRIMCLMHKSEEYGTILLKQKYKQNTKQSLNFALQLAKSLPYNLLEIEESIDELLSEKVLELNGDILTQKRMIKDNEISIKRSNSGSIGGKTTQKNNNKFATKFAKAKNKANTESEYVNEIDNSLIKKKGSDKKKYGEFQNVFLTDEEYYKSLEKYGEPILLQMIEKLSTYLKSKGDKYKNHYATFSSWVHKTILEENGNNNSNKNGNNPQWANGGTNGVQRQGGKQPYVFSGAEFSAKVQERLKAKGIGD